MFKHCQTRKRTAAQGVVEFALVGPIFFLMLLGVVEMGRLMWVNHELSEGTRVGARWAAVRGEHFQEENPAPTNDDVKDVIIDKTSALAAADLSANLSWSANGAPGSTVTVSTTYQFRPLIGGFLGINGFTMNRQSVMTVHY